jgi:2-polyprenyl-3-methyl-5-hydroxy-6-metoxy-1,4-benzoquinol methylase
MPQVSADPCVTLAKEIARCFSSPLHRKYTEWKLRLDSLYQTVTEALHGRDHPVLDLGCGLGLLAFYLRKQGFMQPVLGLDFDHKKIAAAQKAAGVFPPTPQFQVADLLGDWPAYYGSVMLLDVLHYVDVEARPALLRSAAERTAIGGALIIRSGISDGSRRHRFTRTIDRLAAMLLWMKSGPASYPTQDWLEKVLAECGLELEAALPPIGNSPFNNYMFIFTRR